MTANLTIRFTLARTLLGLSFVLIGVSAKSFLAAQREYHQYKSVAETEQGVAYQFSRHKPVKRISSAEFSGFPLSVRLMNSVHILLRQRGEIFSGRNYPLRERMYTSGSDHLFSGQGACGSFSWALTELLHVSGVNARLTKLKCKTGEICHSVVEAEVGGKWILLDPVQNLFYLNPQGEPASIREIAADQASPFWASKPTTTLDFKELQLTPGDIVYTNWRKIPFFGVAIERLIKAMPEGHALKTLSLRSYFLNTHAFVSVTAFGLAVVLGIASAMLKRGMRLATGLNHHPAQLPRCG